MARLSMKGWNVAEFVKGNSEMLKLLAGALVTLASNASVGALWGIVAGVAAKALLDVVHYYVVE